MEPTTWIPAEESSRPREQPVRGPTVEDSEETKSGVAAVWGPSQRVACNEVRKVSSVQNCRALRAMVRSLSFISRAIGRL